MINKQNSKQVIISDIDNTLIFNTRALKKAKTAIAGNISINTIDIDAKKLIFYLACTKFHNFFYPNLKLIKILKTKKKPIILVSARMDILREETEQMLAFYKIPYNKLILRKSKFFNIRGFAWKAYLLNKLKSLYHQIDFYEDDLRTLKKCIIKNNNINYFHVTKQKIYKFKI